MRVEHDGANALVASNGGAVKHPVWYHNLVASPLVELRDGPDVWDLKARPATGEERQAWWERAVDAFPDYADHQRKTDREIPLFVVERID
jgi:deazaflavin-dependent oxidoreductase (nitroreductase family)